MKRDFLSPWNLGGKRPTRHPPGLRVSPLVFAAVLLFVFAMAGGAPALDMLADIREDVPTEFGVYYPRLVDVVPDVPPYTVAPDLSNVVNLADFNFTDPQKALLQQNGFVAARSTRTTICSLYTNLQAEQLPIFVTVDALLHIYHKTYDNTLQTLELTRFISDVDGLTSALLSCAREQYDLAEGTTMKNAAGKNLAYLAVASNLLGTPVTVPTEIATLVDQELDLIRNTRTIAQSPIFGYPEDYSQYVPRGHYTRTELLQRYFQCMMWYGRMIFHAGANPMTGVTEDMAREATRRALLLAALLDGGQVGPDSALEVWQRVYRPTVFTVGKSDDYTPVLYLQMGEEIFGAPLSSLPVEAFADDAKINALMAELAALPPPRIAPGEGRGFRFMGQRFIPDAYMFQKLVFPELGTRLLPEGLDVMGVLGSDRAIDNAACSELAYPGKILELRDEFADYPAADWAQNLYWNWLYCLMPMLAPKGEGFPFFMQTPAWADKELACALGSWAELRHDTILYAKPSVTPLGGMGSGYRQAYVEPNPWAFARLASLVQLHKEGLDGLGLLTPDIRERFDHLHAALVTFQGMAEKELTNRPLTIEEIRMARGIGPLLEDLLEWMDPLSEPPPAEPSFFDPLLPVIADVHTDLNTKQCLEVGVGEAMNLFVLVPTGEVPNELAVSCGAAYAYYEFPWPISNRLTDEAWRDLPRPAPPEWTTRYATGELEIHGGYDYFDPTEWIYDAVVTPFSSAPHVGTFVQVNVVVSAPFHGTPYVEIAQEDKVLILPLDGNASTSLLGDYQFVMNSWGWFPGWVKVTVFTPESVEVIAIGGFELYPAVPAGVNSWILH